MGKWANLWKSLPYLDRRFWRYQRAALVNAYYEAWEWSPLPPKPFIFTILAFIASLSVAKHFGELEGLITKISILGIGVQGAVWIAFLISERAMAPVRFVDALEMERNALKQELERLNTPKLVLWFKETDTRYLFKDGDEEVAYIR